MTDSAWTEWQPLPLTLPPAVLAELLDGGQSFRWNFVDGAWVGCWGNCAARIRTDEEHRLHWCAPAALAEETAGAIGGYFALASGLEAQLDALPWRSDPHLAACLRAFPGLRLLRQPFGETLLGFLCSATKQIVQIKQMMALLTRHHGSPLAPGFARLPTWSELASVSEKTLRECKLGFRARHIHETARFLAAHPGWLAATEAAPYPEARERLCSLPGVGEKVADCVLLFGAGKLEAFPVDVWILRTLEHRYGLAGWKPAQLAQFGRAHFGPFAGLAQQYLFAWERRNAADERRQRTRPPHPEVSC